MGQRTFHYNKAGLDKLKRIAKKFNCYHEKRDEPDKYEINVSRLINELIDLFVDVIDNREIDKVAKYVGVRVPYICPQCLCLMWGYVGKTSRCPNCSNKPKLKYWSKWKNEMVRYQCPDKGSSSLELPSYIPKYRCPI